VGLHPQAVQKGRRGGLVVGWMGLSFTVYVSTRKDFLSCACVCDLFLFATRVCVCVTCFSCVVLVVCLCVWPVFL